MAPVQAIIAKELRSYFVSPIVYVVGGVEPDGLGPWLSAGAAGFGIGSSLYKPGRDVAAVGAVAAAHTNSLS